MLLCFVSCLILFIFPRGVKISLLIIGYTDPAHVFGSRCGFNCVSAAGHFGENLSGKATSTDLFDTTYLYYTKSDNQNGRLCAI